MDKSIIKNILREEFIAEEISAGSFIVYHRTQSEPKDFNKGFKTGFGKMYGPGLYTTYDLATQLTPNMINTYGNIIIQFKIQNNNKFIILDYAEAKKVYGTKYTLIDQLKRVMGGYFNKFYRMHSNELIKYSEKLQDEYYDKSSYVAEPLSQLKDFYSHVDGLIFTGNNDGKVLVLFNTNLANPLKYSMNDGESWSSLKTSDSHQIGKDSRALDKISNALRYDDNILTPKDIVNALTNTPEIAANFNDDILRNIIRKFTNPMYIFDLLVNNPYLNEYWLRDLILKVKNVTSPEKVLNYVLDRPKLIPKIQYDIPNLIDNLPDSPIYFEIFKKYIKASKLIHIGYYSFEGMMNKVLPEQQIELIYLYLEIKEDLFSDDIIKLSNKTQDSLGTCLKLLDMGLINRLTETNIRMIIIYYMQINPEIIYTFFNDSRIIKKLDTYEINKILKGHYGCDTILIQLLTNNDFLNRENISGWDCARLIQGTAFNKVLVSKKVAGNTKFFKSLDSYDLHFFVDTLEENTPGIDLELIKIFMKHNGFADKVRNYVDSFIEKSSNPEAMRNLLMGTIQEIKKMMKNLLIESFDKTITCSKCGWHWKESESDKKDMYICHKCGHDNTPKKESLNERILTKTEKDTKIMAAFVNFAKKELGIEDDIKVAMAFERTPDITTTAYYNMDGFVKIYVKDRAIIDVCRSIAHELVHHKQNIDGRLDANSGDTGSEIENEANSKAGIILREYGKLNPKIYEILL